MANDVVAFADMALPQVGYNGQVVRPYSELQPMRIIGVELRLRDDYNGMQDELMMLACNLIVPSQRQANQQGRRGQFYMPCTLHTTEGDTNFDIRF